MTTLTAASVLPAEFKSSIPLSENRGSLLHYRRIPKKGNKAIVPVARLFGPAIFMKVLFLGVEEKKHPGNLLRTYTLTHSDITSKLTLAISQTINNSQLQGCELEDQSWATRCEKEESPNRKQECDEEGA